VTVKRDKVEYKALGSIPTPKKKRETKWWTPVIPALGRLR
jgi:hypothetical protein